MLSVRHKCAGTRQAFLPGGHRTGAPGKHVVRGKAKYRLVDEQVRVFVAPPIEEIQNSAVRVFLVLLRALCPCPQQSALVASQLKAYVSTTIPVSRAFNKELYGKLPRGGLTGEHYFKIAPRLDAPTSDVPRVEAGQQ